MVHSTLRFERDRGGRVLPVEGGFDGGVSGQAAGPVPGERVAHVAAGGRVRGGGGQLMGAVKLLTRTLDGRNFGGRWG